MAKSSNPVLIDFKILEAFLQVAREGSFSRAAKSLERSQPTLSQQIAKLERQLQLVLFNRSTRDVLLTRDGLEFVELAKPVIEKMKDALRGAERLRAKKCPILRIGVPSYTANIPERQLLIEGFIEKVEQPDAFQINDSGQVSLINLLLEGSLDVAILVGQELDRAVYDQTIEKGLSAEGAYPADLNVVVSKHKPLVLTVPCEHPLASCEEISPQDLAGIEIIMMDLEYAPHLLTMIRDFLASADADIKSLPGSTDLDIHLIACRTRTISVSTDWFFSPSEASGDMVRRMIKGWKGSSSLAVVVSPESRGEMLEDFIEHAKQCLTATPF